MLAVNGLYGHIRRNTLISCLLLAGFGVLIAVYWYAWCLAYSAILAPFADGPAWANWRAAYDAIDAAARARAVSGWYVPLVIVATWFAVAWRWHARIIRTATGARPVQRREAPKLYNAVENIAIAAGLPMPLIEIMESSALNAYAAGLTPTDATIAVTRGLLDRLDQRELEAVIAHEMTHIRNRDVRLLVIALIFTGCLTLLGDGISAWRNRRRRGSFWSPIEGASGGDWSGGGAGAVVLAEEEAAVAGIVGVAVAATVTVATLAIVHAGALLSQFGISRSREFMADAGAVELTKDPDALISALRKIAGHDAVPLASEGMRAMMISAGHDQDDFVEALLATHPPIAARIDCLMQHGGGRDVAGDPTTAGRRRAPAVVDADLAPAGIAGFAGARPSFGRRGSIRH
jgi:heat shock protein HtpX